MASSIEALLRRAMMVLILAIAAASPAAMAAPIPIRVVVVTMFEIGSDTGDTPGEFQDWVERLPLDEKLDFPQGYRALRLNREKGILGLVTGIGTAHAAASIMALGWIRASTSAAPTGWSPASPAPIPPTCRWARPPGPNG